MSHLYTYYPHDHVNSIGVKIFSNQYIVHTYNYSAIYMNGWQLAEKEQRLLVQQVL